MKNSNKAYALLVETCKEYGISRSTAYKLVSQGHLESFNIGRRRYVMIESLTSLPYRIGGLSGGDL